MAEPEDGPTEAFRFACVMRGSVYTIDDMRFEWHPRLGPAVVGKRGILNTQPGPRHRFWQVVTWWAQQGHVVTADGVCVYHEPTPPRSVRLAGRHHAVVPDGREPEDVRREWFAKMNHKER
jgi:hypothetical protein